MTTHHNYEIYDELHTEKLVSDESFEKLQQRRSNPLLSVHWEVKTVLYLGITLLTGGVGTLVYKNIDTIGHQVIIAFIALLTVGCFTYSFKHKKPYSRSRVETPNTFFDYVLLLGTLSFLIFVGYLQYQYTIFGTNYGLATAIPMVALFYIAYDFDHIGILNMAIANLGVWMGVTATPRHLLAEGTFNSQSIIFAYLAFGLLLLAAAWCTQKFVIKKHFKFTYEHYGIHASSVALLAGYFFNYDESISFIWLFAALGLSVGLYFDSFKEKSYYFALLSVLYGYFATSCLVFRILSMDTVGEGIIAMGMMYMTLSAVGVIFLLTSTYKKFKTA
ncbi:DUF2157 domain-containing protein [Mucilaginibacter galii]|uniref:DUF2157 domain-containing protein n=1 Tax=Mucilaginibacter galii TaxID=2005073 RepID=A0A917JAY6_9SPHI|nr:DUF2157 domain-containing protein [Mucilaginibacter galii]GGI50384.1 hypothetical protein GCM10011425_15960 [Mucilaginibacter galii]